MPLDPAARHTVLASVVTRLRLAAGDLLGVGERALADEVTAVKLRVLAAMRGPEQEKDNDEHSS